MNKKIDVKEILLRCIITAFCTLAVIAASFYWVWNGGSFNYPYNDLPFDRQVWLKHYKSSETENPRLKMAEDIRHRWVRKGMTRQEVIKLLGEPDYKKQPHLYEYNLGYIGFAVDPDSLDIDFNRSGRVVRITITQH